MKHSFSIFLFFVLSCNARQKKGHVGDASFHDTSTKKTSVIISFNKKGQVELGLSEILQRNDTLFIQLTDTSKYYELNIISTRKKYSCILKQGFSVADSSYKLPVFSLIEQNITLNRASVAPGDLLQGSVNLKFSVFHHWVKTNTDTISANGTIYAMID